MSGDAVSSKKTCTQKANIALIYCILLIVDTTLNVRQPITYTYTQIHSGWVSYRLYKQYFECIALSIYKWPSVNPFYLTDSSISPSSPHKYSIEHIQRYCIYWKISAHAYFPKVVRHMRLFFNGCLFLNSQPLKGHISGSIRPSKMVHLSKFTAFCKGFEKALIFQANVIARAIGAYFPWELIIG